MKSLFYSILLLSTLSFSQIQTLKGKVIVDNTYIANAEIINVRTKQIAVSDASGSFTIDANSNDLLVIIAKDCLDKKVYLSPSLLSQKDFSVTLFKVANVLNEVIVNKEKEQFVTPIQIEELTKINNYNRTITANQTGVYTGELINAMDFVAIGKLIARAFKNKKKKKKSNIEVDFHQYCKENFEESFFHETLKLNSDTYFRFIEFCSVDPTSKSIITNQNEFEVLNFFIEKKIEFDKL